MTPRLKKLFARYNTGGATGFSWLKYTLQLIWIDIRYDVEEWIMNKTWKFRLKHSKRVQLFSLAYNQPESSWDDVEVADQWGFWLPIGFGIVSKANWDFDQKINQDIGQPEEKWEDFIDGDWPTYYYKDQFLTNNHYFDAARNNLKRRIGDQAYKKEFELRLFVQSQESLDEETRRWVDWVAAGSPPMKIEFAEGAKESLKDIVGEEGAREIVEDLEKRNKEIDERKGQKPEGT